MSIFTGKTPFIPTLLSQPMERHNPIIFDGSTFADGKHRVAVSLPSHRELYKTANFTSFTPVDMLWMDSVAHGGANSFQDACLMPDGSWLIAHNDNSAGSTALWTGSSQDIDDGTITRVGRATGDCGDAGIIHGGDGLVHIFGEMNVEAPYGSASSTTMGHYTVPDNDLTNSTRRADVFLTGGAWGTGDPDIIRFQDRWYMFFDYTIGHPAYWIGIAVSDDLYNWSILDADWLEDANIRAGDFDVIENGDHFIALSEYTDNEPISLGVWRLDIRPTALRSTDLGVGSSRATMSLGGAGSTVRRFGQ